MRVRSTVLGLGVLSPVIADGHILNVFSLPLLFAIVGAMTTVSSAMAARTLPRLFAGVVARRNDAALVRRLAGLCGMDDFPQRQERVSELVSFLARKTGLRRRQQSLLATASTLHRIGIVSLPPCPSCDRDGVVRGATKIAERLLAGPTALHHAATEMALSHEESWDGAGLPGGLAGMAIPFPARLLQVALALDALLPTTEYVPDRTALGAIAGRIQAEGGRTLDPDLAALPCRYLADLECLLTSRPAEPHHRDLREMCVAVWTRITQASGSMLTPA